MTDPWCWYIIYGIYATVTKMGYIDGIHGTPYMAYMDPMGLRIVAPTDYFFSEGLKPPTSLHISGKTQSFKEDRSLMVAAKSHGQGKLFSLNTSSIFTLLSASMVGRPSH